MLVIFGNQMIENFLFLMIQVPVGIQLHVVSVYVAELEGVIDDQVKTHHVITWNVLREVSLITKLIVFTLVVCRSLLLSCLNFWIHCFFLQHTPKSKISIFYCLLL